MTIALLLALCAARQPPPPDDAGDGVAIACALSRFPPALAADQLATLADEHCDWLERVAALNADRPYWWEVRAEARHRALAWHYLRTAHDPTWDTPTRRDALRQLESLLPPGWYELGWLPCPVLWDG